jgi:hypothetical protein
MPHMPQLLSSVCRFLQAVPQPAWPVGQQTPAEQTLPVPQLPLSRLLQVHDGPRHCLQAPVQAVAQQRLLTHWPEEHSPLATHMSPLAFLAGSTQLPPMHTSGDAHICVSLTHAPLALQTRVLRTLPEQLAAPQLVPVRSRWHPPVPLQPLEQASSAHAPEGSAPPAGTSEQTPSRPRTAQDRHVPLQAVRQQRPWAHWLLSHCPLLLQLAPSGRLPQSPLVQTFPLEHCELPSHPSMQRLPVQPR